MAFLSKIIAKITNTLTTDPSELTKDNQPSTQIYRRDPTMHIVKTLDLSKLIQKIKYSQRVDKSDLDDFLEEIPIASNYLIEFSKSEPNGCVSDIFNRYLASITCIEDHIKVNKLTDNCFIGLSKNQQRQLT